MWRASVIFAILLLATLAEAFVPPAVKRGGVKGMVRKPIAPLEAAPKKNGGSAKKKVKKVKKKKAVKKKKSVKKNSVKKKAAKKKTTTKAKNTKTAAAPKAVAEAPPVVETRVADPAPPEIPAPPVAAGIRVRTASEIPLHEIGAPPTSHKPRQGIDSSLVGDLTGGRPGAIIETEEQLERKQIIFDELAQGLREYKDGAIMKDYGTLQEDIEAEYDIDDPDLVDASTLGTWTIRDLQSKFPYEWDPEAGDEDPNRMELQQPGVQYKDGVEVDEDGVEIGYDPMFGPSAVQDERTILGAMESYMINEKTKDAKMIPPQFAKGDLELDLNQEVVKFRKSLDIIETYTDDFLPPTVQVPRHLAKWHGYPEPMSFPHKNYTNNFFLEDTPNPTDWAKLTPYQARRKAVELARAQNAEWLPNGKSQAWHNSQREPYDRAGTLVGSLRKAEVMDETLVKAIQPALDVLGSVVDLLSIEDGTVFRFYYYGLMKNRHGMAAWSETLIRDCGVEVTGIRFETGFRRRDQAYEGGDCWYPPST